MTVNETNASAFVDFTARTFSQGFVPGACERTGVLRFGLGTQHEGQNTMNLEQLRKRQEEITTRQKELAAAAKANGNVFTDEDREEWDTLQSEYDGNSTKITDLEKKAQEDANRLRAMSARKPQPSPRKVPEDANVPAPENTTPNFEKDPKKGFDTPRDFLMAVMTTNQRGLLEDQRLKLLAAGSDEQSTVADPYGGFLVPAGFMPEVMKVMAEADPLANLVRRIPMTSTQVPINARVDKDHSTSVSGGFVVYRRVETQAVTASRQQYEQVTLNANSLMGLAYASEELLARSPISFVSLIEDGMRDEFPAKLMQERISGTGVGQFEGVLNSPAKLAITKETGQAAATIQFENIIKMSARCWGYGNSVYLANHTARTQLRTLTQAIGTGGVSVPLFTNDGGVERLDGRPIFFTEFCPTLGTEGDLILINPSQYLEGVLTPMQSAESMHVRFENHERTFKFWMENDGRGWWRSVLTPKNGDTLSPFVTIATRS